MKRLTPKEIIKIRQFSKEGYSLNKICKIMKLKKSTVYYHFRKVKGRTIRQPKIQFKSKRELGDVIGIFAGDGSLHFEPKGYNYQVRIHFGFNNINYLIYVKSFYEKVFGKKFSSRPNGKNTLIIETKSKTIFHFFHKFLNFENQNKALTVNLKEEYKNDREFLIGFLRGLLDTDGTICYVSNNLKIVFYTSSKKLSFQISNFLKIFNIKHGISEDKRRKNISYHIYILKESINDIIELLNPVKWADRSMVE